MDGVKPDRTPHVCFLSNGYGEDRSAALIAQELKAIRPDVEISGAPLITTGEEYARRGIPVLFKGSLPPSGGFPTLSTKGFLQDFTYNHRHLAYCRTLRRLRHSIDHAVVVGDTFLLALEYPSLKIKPVHFSLSKSDYKNSHFWFELAVFRHVTRKVLTRDAFTGANLRKKGVNASYLGNPIMDGLTPRGIDLGSGRMVGILPGSKDESFGNLRKMLEVVSLIEEDVVFLCGLSPHLDEARMAESAGRDGWTLEGDTLRIGKHRVRLLKHAFEDILADSEVLISLAGTASEQAVGLGKPVVSFTGCGSQTHIKRMRDQERLLGGSVKLITDGPQAAAAEVSRLLDPAECKRRGEAGKARMGVPGASARIAHLLTEEFEL